MLSEWSEKGNAGSLGKGRDASLDFQTCSLENMDVFHFVPSFKFRKRAASKLFSPSFFVFVFFAIFIIA